MASYVIADNRTTTVQLAAGDTLHLTTGIVEVSVLLEHAIVGAGNNALTIDGQAISHAGFGIAVGGQSSVTVGSGGLVQGYQYGLVTYGLLTVVNRGSISGTSTGSPPDVGGTGVSMGGVLHNYGTIFGAAIGVSIGGELFNAGDIWSDRLGVVIGATNGSLGNIGTIDAGLTGILVSGGEAGDFSTIVNQGEIYGRSGYGIAEGQGSTRIGPFDYSGQQIVVNNGFIFGATAAVNLRGGDDFYDGRKGGQIGAVLGGDGNDVLYGGIVFDDLQGEMGDDQLNGGGGADNLHGGFGGHDFARYDFGGAVTVSLLNPASNTGDAAGDTFTSIEAIAGSSHGDVLIGDAMGNSLFGLGGADALAGGAGTDSLYGGDGFDILFGEGGNDTLSGGAGGDWLRGGADADTYVYGGGDQGDLILNFNEGGVRDSFDLRGYFDAAGFTGNDPRGAGVMQVLQSGADTDVYLHGTFAFRIQGVVAAAIDDTYFLFQ